MVSRFLFFCLILLSLQLASGQDLSGKRYRKTLIPLPVLGNSPETGFFGGASATIDFAPVFDSLARHSVLSSELTFSAKKQFVFASEWDITNRNRDYILFGENSWMRFPELFWGFGSNSDAFNEVLYDAYRIEMENGFYLRLAENLYAGIDQQYQSLYGLKIEDAGESSESIRAAMKAGVASGFGLGIILDSRSNLLNPRAGEYLMMLHGLYFGKIFGSDYRFPHVHADMRCYLKAGGKKILALHASSELFGEGSPFRLQAMLGGSSMMRGLYQGRYRDQNQISAQAEFRMPVWRWLGAVGFASAGNVFSLQHPERNGNLKTAAGLGIRLRVDKKENTNLRLDYGWVNDGSQGFYLSFGEAF